MNEKIKELVSKATYTCLGDKHPTSVNDYELVNEELVKLVVKECIKSLWTEECNYSDLAIHNYNTKAQNIKNKFGLV